ncbi:alpha/beta-hydrolase [Mytilinidion resinicola]|uniref:Alpha/beta-hydrolase n=1 Tax=Mytilinidion resinicola TaxID=574789 RepID=A0A6A6YVD9_9PEZI|nr:alpha/beta-hydrolase [Mytilinidion resinicola]KAF2811954.1 alpha/beta-hydrolase [Mytilinidion resinicola]
MYLYLSVAFGLLAISAVQSSSSNGGGFNLRPFRINLSSGVSRMLNFVNNTQLPGGPEYLGASAGIPLDTLKSLRAEWLTRFDWDKEQLAINAFNHFTAEVEGLTIHFIHEKSRTPNAIPLILIHGWPGSFLEFLPVIDPLLQNSKTSTDTPITFDIIIPSLPGYAFSSAPPQNWTIDDTARVYNTLMTDVLGYSEYATHGTDWGSFVAYSLYGNFNGSVRASHFCFLPFSPQSPTELAALNVSLSPLEAYEEQEAMTFDSSGIGYTIEQSTEPNTIGLALYDNPVGQLAWIGQKFLNWSDPRAGTPPSVLDHNEILKSVSLYYLTKSLVSSMYIYFQNPEALKTVYSKAQTDAPMLFSGFKYNPGFWPPALVAQVGNLVLYRNHDFGGHFAGIDNPPALIKDLREIGTYWA